jgi:hypothetical protein
MDGHQCAWLKCTPTAQIHHRRFFFLRARRGCTQLHGDVFRPCMLGFAFATRAHTSSLHHTVASGAPDGMQHRCLLQMRRSAASAGKKEHHVPPSLSTMIMIYRYYGRACPALCPIVCTAGVYASTATERAALRRTTSVPSCQAHARVWHSRRLRPNDHIARKHGAALLQR